MEKYELAFDDYQNGMKYKDIARKYNVSINTVKSWKSRKWAASPNKRVAHKERKGCTQRKPNRLNENNDLTDQQKMFCLLYLQCFNATKAYQQAYQCDYKTANSNAFQLMVKTGIKKELQRLKTELLQDTFLTIKDLIREYTKQAFSDITDYVDFGTEQVKAADGSMVPFSFVRLKQSDGVDGTLIQEVKRGRDGISIKLWDKQKAMGELVKYLSNNTADEGEPIVIIDPWSDRNGK